MGPDVDGKSATDMLELNDRQMDAWDSLLVIADAAGGDWPTRARAAALALSDDDDEEDPTQSTIEARAVRDCYAAWDSGATFMPAQQLVDRMREMLDAPWALMGSGGLSTVALGRMLATYHVHSVREYVEKTRVRGFRLADVERACIHYGLADVTPRPTADGVDYVADFVDAIRAGRVARDRPRDGVHPDRLDDWDEALRQTADD